MKKNFIAIILTSFFFVLSFVLTAQSTPPDINDGSHGQEGGQESLGGGGAPIGGGTLILIGLGIAYGGKRGYKIYKDNQEELED